MLTHELPFLPGHGRDVLRQFSGKAIPAILIIYLFLILPFHLPNAGGSGLSLPQNMLAWGAMTLCIAVALLRTIRSGRMLMWGIIPFAGAGAILLVLPWLWTAHSFWQDNALPRLAGIAGALLFLLALCQQHLSVNAKRALVGALVVAALVQAFTAMAEGWVPSLVLSLTGSLPNGVLGVFQQRNLLGSWLAMGIGLALYLIITARLRRRALGWALMLYPLVAALILSQSRTGLIGAVAMFIIAAAASRPRWRHRPLTLIRHVILLMSLMVWAGGISLWVMPSGAPADFKHSASSQQRLNIIRGTLTLIARHPLAGNGLGSFEALFPQALANTELESQENDTLTHPHNEVLYIWAEGGLVALSGLLLLSALWLWPTVRALRQAPRSFSLTQDNVLLPLAGLPLLIHMMTEYPLYLSTPHLLALLLLFRCALPETTYRPCRVSLPVRTLLLPIGLTVCIAVVAILGAGVQVQSELTRAEDDMNAGMIPTIPASSWKTLTQNDRLDYDRHMLTVAQPAFWRSMPAMETFTVWGLNELAVHNDAEVSAVMMAIARHRGDSHARRVLARKAARVYVADARFTVGRP